MNQILSWICLISVCALSLQVMLVLCENTIKLFDEVSVKNKKGFSSNNRYDYSNKIAK